MKLDKRYEPKAVEEKWHKYWIEKGLFRADASSPSTSFAMVIPPPNITGSLHMGHALNNTLQDVLTRYKKMTGFEVLWVPGTDHAGIATQNVVERVLRAEGLERKDVGREALIKRIWKWREDSGSTIVNQLKRLGAGCDWSRERFTMDPGLSEAVKEVFVSLYKDGLIYRDNYMINWCPRCETALSDLEVEHKDDKGRLYYIDYPLEDGKGSLTIATTRPETMLGDTAVAVSPEDERYKGFIGKNLILPLVERKIPVIGDEYVDSSFGTGALKITPAHDPNDFLIGHKYGLDMPQVIGHDGTMTGEAGSDFAGLDRFVCRKKVVERLKQEGLLVKVEEHDHAVGHCYRCDTVIEPLIKLQWFVKMKPLAAPAIEAVRDGRIKFIPKGWENTYFSWMENIKDWCISRQIFWGHRIPVWYCGKCSGDKIHVVFRDTVSPDSSDEKPLQGGNYSLLRSQGFSPAQIDENADKYIIETVERDKMIVSKEAPEKCPCCGGNELIQDPDVLDTWFSSGLWPFSTMGWPKKTKELEKFYPTSVLVTSFDIIFFWVARMIMMGIKFMGDIPFSDVYIHALVRDADGQKMSKSRGNVIDPLIMMDKYGTDALRFTLVALAAQGRDIKLSEERMEGYRNFVNKLWNASRFVFMNLEDGKNYNDDTSMVCSDLLMDRWILSRFRMTVRDVRSSIEEYRFNEAASLLYQFIWHEYCDWYIEASKPILNGESGEDAKEACRSVIFNLLKDILRMLHPFMPFVTEEIWHGMGHEESILLSGYPEVREELIDNEAIVEADFIMELIKGVRNLRFELNIPLNAEVKLAYVEGGGASESIVKREEYLVKRLAKVSSIEGSNGRPASSIPLVIKDVELFMLLDGAVDLKEEERRLKKGRDKALKELDMIERKLANKGFLEKAPKDVVAKERKKAAELSEKIGRFKDQIERIISI